jgi:hypothetical protein
MKMELRVPEVGMKRKDEWRRPLLREEANLCD